MTDMQTRAAVNLRAGPSTDHDVIVLLPEGSRVEPLTDYSWRHVRTPHGDGWIASDYLIPLPESSGLIFNPDTPEQYQNQDWTCSIRTLMWMLASIGISTDPGEVQDYMSPRWVTPELGLLNADGSGLVAALKEKWAITAYNYCPVSYAEVSRLAGTGPLSLGLRNWGGPGMGHWSAVSGKDHRGLILANPARGNTFGQDAIDQAFFDSHAGWGATAVYIPV